MNNTAAFKSIGGNVLILPVKEPGPVQSSAVLSRGDTLEKTSHNDVLFWNRTARTDSTQANLLEYLRRFLFVTLSWQPK